MPTAQRFGPILFIPGENGGKYPHCNSIYVEPGRVLIDPGSNRSALTALRDGPGVSQIWLSHWHEDHLIHLDLFDDVPVWIHGADAPQLVSLDAFMDGYGLPDGQLRSEFGSFLQQVLRFTPRSASRTLRGGEMLVAGGVPVRVVHAPGHTPGHCAFWFADESILYVADYDLTPFGPWYGDPGSSIADCLASVRRLQRLGAELCLGAHDTGVYARPAASLWDDYLAAVDRREARYLELLAEPCTVDELAAAWVVFRKPREPLKLYAWAERVMAEKHLERFVALGRVQERDGTFRSV